MKPWPRVVIWLSPPLRPVRDPNATLSAPASAWSTQRSRWCAKPPHGPERDMILRQEVSNEDSSGDFDFYRGASHHVLVANACGGAGSAAAAERQTRFERRLGPPPRRRSQ